MQILHIADKDSTFGENETFQLTPGRTIFYLPNTFISPVCQRAFVSAVFRYNCYCYLPYNLQ